MYTTGEMAKACGVTVRTVQYYDNRELLMPSELSEGGRRLYSEEDLQKLKIICYLRELGLPLESIRQLMHEKHPQNVIETLLEEQQKTLTCEIEQRQEKLRSLQGLKAELKSIGHFTVESISDIAYIMENKAKTRHTHRIILAVGLVAEFIEASTLTLGILKGVWFPFALGMIPVIGLCVWATLFYYRRTAYICPECHCVFKPAFQQVFWAWHTLSTRKLTCTGCGHHGFCVETYGKDNGYAQN